MLSHARHAFAPLSFLPHVLALTLLPTTGVTQSAPSASDSVALQRVLVAEDARGTGPEGLAPLLDALTGADPVLRRVAVRGVGRLQRPELANRLLALLGDAEPAVRAEAANALAQSMRRVRRDAPPPAEPTLTTSEAADTLARLLFAETDPGVADAIAQSLGRLPLPDSATARAAERAIRERLARQPTPGVVHGLYTLARARRATGALDSGSVALLRRVGTSAADTMSRRLAILTLAATAGLDSATAERAAGDRDAEVRRSMLRGLATLSASQRASLVRRGLADPDPIVRVEAVVASRVGGQPPDCSPLFTAARDRHLYVALAAVDSIGGGCTDVPAAVRALTEAAGRRIGGPPDHRWQLGAHALVSLARLDRAAAAPRLRAASAAPRWEVRQYAARTAAVLEDRAQLEALARDPDHNVQEAAIAGLAATAGRAADSLYIRALASPGFQVVLAASEALKSTTDPEAASALLAAFDRLSALRSENARDPRVSILERLGELNPTNGETRLRPYLADFDTTVAATVATLVSRWSGSRVDARPIPLPVRREPLAAIFLAPDLRVRVTLAPSSGGGSFVVRLLPDEAPATVARVLRLAQEGYYDGRVFQRVEPNFVVQGGGPDANEYVGDAAFMRDELARRTHARGTIGISARGRDTGDGQWFINLVDNPLLDHEYTIFGIIVSGRSVAERMLEDERIARIEILPPGR